MSLTAIARDSAGATIRNALIAFASSNIAIATVSAAGAVTVPARDRHGSPQSQAP